MGLHSLHPAMFVIGVNNGQLTKFVGALIIPGGAAAAGQQGREHQQSSQGSKPVFWDPFQSASSSAFTEGRSRVEELSWHPESL